MSDDWTDEEVLDALDVVPGSRPQRDDLQDRLQHDLSAAASPAVLEAVKGMCKSLPSERGYPKEFTVEVGLARNGVEASGYVAGGECYVTVRLQPSWRSDVLDQGLTGFSGLFIAQVLSTGPDGYPDQALAVRLVQDPLSREVGAPPDEVDWVFQLAPVALRWTNGNPNAGEWPDEPRTVRDLLYPQAAVAPRPRRASLPFAADEPPNPSTW